MPTWRYEPVGDLDESLAERLRHFPREPDMAIYGVRFFAALVIRAWLRLYHRFEICGREKLPKEGSFVLVSNHASHLDVLCLLAALPLRKLHRAFPAAAEDYFFVNLPRVAAAAVLFNALPFARLSHVRQSLDLCRQLLATPGNILILFPEGTRSTTGLIGDFRPGIGLLVAGTSIPVVACYLGGPFRAWPKGRRLPIPRRVQLRIGSPRNYATFPREREAALQIASEIRSAILELSR